MEFKGKVIEEGTKKGSRSSSLVSLGIKVVHRVLSRDSLVFWCRKLVSLTEYLLENWVSLWIPQNHINDSFLVHVQ